MKTQDLRPKTKDGAFIFPRGDYRGDIAIEAAKPNEAIANDSNDQIMKTRNLPTNQSPKSHAPPFCSLREKANEGPWRQKKQEPTQEMGGLGNHFTLGIDRCGTTPTQTSQNYGLFALLPL